MESKKRVLIVDDELNIRRILQAAFDKQGWHAAAAQDAEEALTIIESEQVDCVLTDITMPGMSGLDLQETIRKDHPGIPVILMTAFGSIPQAVQAIRNGAFEFITKPFDLDVLKKVVKAALEQGPADEDASPRKKSRKSDSGQASEGPEFIAKSPAMAEVMEMMRQAADSRATVLITGESGTGKEVAAKLLHSLSPRAEKPFVAVSCAALPETLLESELFGHEKGAYTGAEQDRAGRFELADKGTLLLDEIGEVPLSVQVKLLRVLQEREIERLGSTHSKRVDVRLIAATNRDLQEAVDAGTFRLDLLYRLQVVELCLPALRDRREDIEPLAYLFLARYAAENGRALTQISEEVLNAFASYSWPGNIRELENTMERAVVLSSRDDEVLKANSLPKKLLSAA